jgi:hypothetical protein
MALQRAKLGDIAFIGSSAGSIYANASGVKTYVKGLVLHNTRLVRGAWHAWRR